MYGPHPEVLSVALVVFKVLDGSEGLKSVKGLADVPNINGTCYTKRKLSILSTSQPACTTVRQSRWGVIIDDSDAGVMLQGYYCSTTVRNKAGEHNCSAVQLCGDCGFVPPQFVMTPRVIEGH